MDIVETQTQVSNATSLGTVDLNNSASNIQTLDSPRMTQPDQNKDITSDHKPKRRKNRLAANFSSSNIE